MARHGLQAVRNYWHIDDLGHLVDGITVQSLIDLLVLTIRQGDQDLGQILGNTN